MRERFKISLLRFMLSLPALVFLTGPVQAGNLEPSTPPGPTTQIPPTWDQILPGSERFELVMGGVAVKDKETGLVWDQSPVITTRSWANASIHCYGREVGGRKGWRLPTIEELASLVDSTQSSPALPSGHPFSNVQLASYWSATTRAGNTTITGHAWYVSFFNNGAVGTIPNFNDLYVWCVRGGQGHDGQ